ncbi:MAG: sulfur carrier protein ThiS, partial [Chthoniobacterales bacterium]
PMNFFLNGEQVERDDAATIDELITRLELAPETTLVEHNGIALRRRDWPNEPVREGDRVEILRVAAGG